MVLGISICLELSCESFVDCLSFSLVRYSKGIGESGEGEDKCEDSEDGICSEEPRRPPSRVL